VYVTHLLRRTFREGGKVKHETLGNISHLPDHVIELIRRALGGTSFLPADDSFRIVRSLPHGHVAAVLGSLKKIGLEHLIASRTCPERTLSVAMIVARIIGPSSKLATARGLNAETCSSSLGQELRIESVSEQDLYHAMDWLLKRQSRIENKLATKHLSDGSLVLYDVSGSYYTGTQCPLAKYGHPRDGKKGFPQILYGLLCNGEGCPVAVEVFEGNRGDPTTLASQVKKILKRFHLERVILVGDRGMITNARINEELRGNEGLDWITALRAPAIATLLEQQVVQPSLFDEYDLAEVASPDYPDERLIVCRNPLLAEERARKRQELLQATEKLLDAVVHATKRKNRPLKGKDRIGVRVGKVINRYKVGKHFSYQVTETSFSYHRNQEKIAKEAALDGLYVIRTSVPAEVLEAESTVRAYKDLSKVERAFRCMKTVDLKVRPIYHYLDGRVRAHVFLCMLAYYVEWHMRNELAPILFEDDEKEAAEALRTSIVQEAQRSVKARRKELTKRTDDGHAVHSFQTLLEDLATVAKNRIKPAAGPEAEFHLLTEPTPLQRRAFELLGLPLSVSVCR
jgi:transposase